MEDKDYIKDLFSEKLQSFEAKVDPSVWTGVQSQLAANTAVGTTTGIALGTKIAAVIGGIAILSTASYFIFSGNEEIKPQVAVQEVENEIIETIQPEEKEILLTETQESINNTKEENITSGNSDVNTNFEIAPVEIDEILDPRIEELPPVLPDPSVDPTSVVNPENVDPASTQNVPLTTSLEVEKLDANRYLFVSSNSEVDYIEWNFGDGNFSNEKETQHVYNSPGKYDVALTVYKGDEKTTVKHQIEIKQAGEFKEFPNVFSPNNDGVNDLFSIESENISEFNLTVFNQKGEMVYKTDDLNFRWTGDDAPEGQYYYIIMAKDSDGVMFNEYQQLEIIRTKR